MDQGKTAGIGNYILSEALHRAAVWPWAACGDLAEADWEALHGAVAEVARGSYASQAERAAARGGLSPTRGSFGDFRLHVYRQERTPDGLAVLRAQGPHGRAVWWVPELQTKGRPEEAGTGMGASS